MRAFTREEWLGLTPEVYLQGGYCGPDGAPRPEFFGDFATAAATQLTAAELSPQELALTVEGIKQILPMHDGPPRERLLATIDECLLVVARAIRQQNNGGLVEWLSECASAVGSAADLDGFMAHIQAVMRLYALLVMPQPEPSGSPQEA
jgi:hypothetical protein